MMKIQRILFVLLLLVACPAIADVTTRAETLTHATGESLRQQLYRAANEANDPDVMYLTGLMFDRGEGVEQFVGVGRYVVDSHKSTADIALVLADAWQGRALGRRLLATLLEHAQTAGVREAVGVVLATNKAMLRLARSMHFAVTPEPGDATVVRIRRDLRMLNAQPH